MDNAASFFFSSGFSSKFWKKNHKTFFGIFLKRNDHYLPVIYAEKLLIVNGNILIKQAKLDLFIHLVLTLSVAIIIRVTFSLPDSLRMSANTRITALFLFRKL